MLIASWLITSAPLHLHPAPRGGRNEKRQDASMMWRLNDEHPRYALFMPLRFTSFNLRLLLPFVPPLFTSATLRLTPAHEWRTRVKGGTDMSETREPLTSFTSHATLSSSIPFRTRRVANEVTR